MKRRRSKTHRTAFKPGMARVSRGWKIGAAASILGLAMLGLIGWWPRFLPALLPKLDLTGLDPAIVKVIDHHRSEVRAHPRSGKAWGELGSVLRAYHFPEAAQRCFAEAERVDAQNPRWPYFHGLLLYADAPDAAVALMRRAAERSGADPEMPCLRLATWLGEAGQWNEAEREIQRLLKAQPGFSPALLLSARRALAQGAEKEAIALAQRCTDDPRTARAATILLATLHARHGGMEAARRFSDRVAALPQDAPVADPYEAEAARLRQDPRVLTEQTHPLLAAGRLPEAESNIALLLQHHAEYAETWLLAGRLQLLQKDLTAAEQFLRRHLELDPRSSQGWFQLGMVQLSQTKFLPASGTFLRATELKPDFGPAFYNRGFALARAGDLEAAIPAFREAVRLNPERIDSYLMLADAALRLGNQAEALAQLEQAAVLNPEHPGLRQLRALAQRMKEPKD